MASTEVPFSIRFTRAQVEKIARVAEVEDRSQASVVRRAVDALDDRALDPQTAVTLGQELQFSGGEKFIVTVAGTTAGSLPAAPAVGATVADGSATLRRER